VGEIGAVDLGRVRKQFVHLNVHLLLQDYPQDAGTPAIVTCIRSLQIRALTTGAKSSTVPTYERVTLL
jgi:hypothetical protein